ncbi:MAG: hypothetical protein ACI9YO_001016 [Gammaproteobacteria bacterium]
MPDGAVAYKAYRSTGALVKIPFNFKESLMDSISKQANIFTLSFTNTLKAMKILVFVA